MSNTTVYYTLDLYSPVGPEGFGSCLAQEPWTLAR